MSDGYDECGLNEDLVAGEAIAPEPPPRDTRFRKGQSGNPRGRPKGSGTLPRALLAELRQTIEITENGRGRKISKMDAMAKSLVNSAIKDARLAALVAKLVAPALVESAAVGDVPLDADDQALLAGFIARNTGGFGEDE